MEQISWQDRECLRPMEIEKRSMEIIEEEMGDTSFLSPEEKLVVKRVIHATADFDYLKNLCFSEGAVSQGLKALKEHAVIVTDTNMAKAGISQAAVSALGCELVCYMADEEVAAAAGQRGITRAVASVEKAAVLWEDRPVIYAVGNAPTALMRLAELIDEKNFVPSLVIGAPVGFVNVIYSKERIRQCAVPYIVAGGRKGGSTVVTAICNALLYQIYERIEKK